MKIGASKLYPQSSKEQQQSPSSPSKRATLDHCILESLTKAEISANIATTVENIRLLRKQLSLVSSLDPDTSDSEDETPHFNIRSDDDSATFTRATATASTRSDQRPLLPVIQRHLADHSDEDDIICGGETIDERMPGLVFPPDLET